MNNLIRFIRRTVDAKKAAKKAQMNEEVILRFYLAERKGRVFVICDGTAVAEMTKTDTVSTVSNILEKMRSAALAYKDLKNVKQ